MKLLPIHVAVLRCLAKIIILAAFALGYVANYQTLFVISGTVILLWILVVTVKGALARKREERWMEQWGELADDNGGRARGQIYSPDYMKRMEILQSQYDLAREQRAWLRYTAGRVE